MADSLPAIEGYGDFLEEIKTRVQQAQIRAALSVNSELILLYWQIGQDILQKQQEQSWGTKVIAQLSEDLREAFPDMKGFSRRNLEFMRSLALAYQDEPIAKQLVSQIPWGHNIRILQKVDTLIA